MRPRWLLEAAGLALLISLPYFAVLLFPGDIALFHHSLHLGNLLCGLLLAICTVAALVLAAMAYFHYRFAPKPKLIAATALSVLVVLRAVDCVFTVVDQWNAGADIPRSFFVASELWSNWFLRSALIAAVVFWGWRRPTVSRLLTRTVRIGLAGFSFCLLWIVPQLLFLAFGLRSIESFHAPSGQLQPIKDRRIVWILFDELSYDQTFDHPADYVRLPNLQNLGAQSISFGDIQPSGFSTEHIVPALLAGKSFGPIRGDSEGMLHYFDNARHGWYPYDANDTLFGLARSAHWNSGIVGWFSPYCRLLRTVVDSCTWQAADIERLPLEFVGASEDKSPIANALVLVPEFLVSRPRNRLERLDLRSKELTNSVAQAKELIDDQRIDFLFIHLPVPHPPGFFDRKTRRFCRCGNYIDNLFLTDDVLGALLGEINRTPSADRTTLIVSSDHSWRVPLWRQHDDWTREEDDLSKGRFDTRPVFLVHFPGETSGAKIPSAVPELEEHDLIASMLQGRIATPESLIASLPKTTSAVQYPKP
jgi:hypothetical protein